MKLSEIKGNRCLDVIADLVDPISRLATTPEVKTLFSGKANEGETRKKFRMRQLREALPTILKTQKKALIEVLAIVNGVAPEEYEQNMTIATLIRDAFDFLTDEGILELFPSAQTKPDGGASSDAQGDIAD